MNNSFIFAGALAAVFLIAAMTSGMVSQINAQILPSAWKHQHISKRKLTSAAAETNISSAETNISSSGNMTS